LDELNLENPLAAGAVKEHRIAIGLPDRGQLDAARAMEAKEDAAGFPAAYEDSFGDLKRIDLEFILLADCVLDITTEVFQVVNLERLSRHWQRKLLPLIKGDWGRSCP